MKPVVYKSKISVGIALPVGLLMTIVIVVCLINHIWLIAAFLGLLLTLVLNLFFTTAYTVSGDVLHIRAGLLYSMEVDISRIKKIRESNNPISSPAASLDRLEIAFNKWDTVLISPKNKMGFILHLLKLNPNIILQLKEQQAN